MYYVLIDKYPTSLIRFDPPVPLVSLIHVYLQLPSALTDFSASESAESITEKQQIVLVTTQTCLAEAASISGIRCITNVKTRIVTVDENTKRFLVYTEFNMVSTCIMLDTYNDHFMSYTLLFRAQPILKYLWTHGKRGILRYKLNCNSYND